MTNGPRVFERLLSRRGFLGDAYRGLATVGLLQLLADESLGGPSDAWQPGRGLTHFPGRARRVLQIFCPGAASHMDLWEHKPELERMHGRPLPGEEEFVSFQGKNGNLMKSPWPFVACGESGKRISSLLPNMARHVDEIAFVHSMTSKTNTHGPGCVFMNTGHPTEGFPSAGAWVSYALGSENENLPTYVALPDIRGEPPNGKANWSNGFLPARQQAIVMNAQQPIRNLYCASRASGVDGLLNWDAHKTLKPDYERHCPIFDQPTAALLTDLRQRGLLDDTLVLWTTEFGRMPTHQAGTTGRDHNPDGFTCWMMGAGIRGGAGVRSRAADLVSQRPRPPVDGRARQFARSRLGVVDRER